MSRSASKRRSMRRSARCHTVRMPRLPEFDPLIKSQLLHKSRKAGFPRPSKILISRNGLALRELERTTCLRTAVLLALDHAAVAGQEATLLQNAAQRGLEVGHGLGNAV